MVSTFTPNINLEEPGRGDQVGVWDTPVNADTTLIDLCLGGIATIGLNNANVVLNAAQFQCAEIIFNSTLTGSVTITFPSTFKKHYTIQNQCTGSSAFVITMKTTNGALGGNIIACPPGEVFECVSDGSNLTFKNFGRVGTYWDYAGSSVPAWLANCTVPPYLNCDGSTFSSSTYPALAVILGSTTLPDARGRARATLNQGTGRLTAAGGGVDGNTLGSGGGSEFTQAHAHANSLNDPSHAHVMDGAVSASPGGAGNFMNANAGPSNGNFSTRTAFTGMTITNASFGAGASQNVQPTYAGGLTLIRAA